MSRSIADSSLTSHFHRLHHYHNWWTQQNHHPFFSARSVVNYLTERFNVGDTVDTLQCRRASISWLARVFRVEDPCDASVRALLAGAGSLRPRRAHYDDTFDLGAFLQWFASTDVPGGDISRLDETALRTVVLVVARCFTGMRSSCAARVLLSTVQTHADGTVSFRTAPQKQARGVGRATVSEPYRLPVLPGAALCPASSFKAYADIVRRRVTAGGAAVTADQRLFVRVGATTAVSADTLGGLVNRVLARAPTDIVPPNTFTSHSLKLALVSHLRECGFSLDDVARFIRAKSPQVLATYYDRGDVMKRAHATLATALSTTPARRTLQSSPPRSSSPSSAASSPSSQRGQ